MTTMDVEGSIIGTERQKLERPSTECISNDTGA